MSTSTANRRFVWLLAFMAIVASGRAPLGAAAPPPLEPAKLYLADGDYFVGELADSDSPDVVSWKSRGASAPYQFPVTALRSIFFPSLEPAKPAEADFCFELSDGDLLFGSLVNITPEIVEIDTQQFGRLHVRRAQIRRIVPWQGAVAWDYSGPGSLADWDHEPEKNGWQEEAGHLLTQSPSALIRKQIKIPPRAAIKLSMSWSKKLDSTFVIAPGGDACNENRGIHLEVWDQTLVLVRESSDDADLATVLDLKTVKNRLNLQILIDQEQGKIAVHSLDGSKLGEIDVKLLDDDPLGWILLRNHRGDVRLEQLLVSKWSGQTPPQVDVTRQRIQRIDGSIEYGDLLGYDAANRRFVLKGESGETTVALDDVAHVVLSTDVQPLEATARLGCHDGNRISGELVKVEDSKLHLKRSGIEETIVVAAADLRCVIGPAGTPEDATNAPLTGRLELDGVLSHGALVDGKSDDKASCLVWQPRLSQTSSPLVHEISGRIVYRDPPPPRPAPTAREKQLQQQAQQRRGIWGAMTEAFSGPKDGAPAPARMSGYPHAIFLVAGDRIPCIISRIDNEGVHFTSSVVETGMVPHEQVKAVELVSRTAAASLMQEKQMRLLTLPRMQKNNPPTHLIASTSGDYLRARLQSMDAQTLIAETRLESKRLPRGRIATIIWLHPVEEKKDDTPKAEAQPSIARVQAVRADGVRLTFTPHEFTNSTLIGKSDLLGPCRVEMKSVDRVLLGDMIEASTDETLYDAWELQDAIEPKYVQDDSAGSAPMSGLNSALIGKPAPEVKLDLLDGGKFRLSEEKGHIVVLDFWATWCAPCMQGMPEVDRVVKEFADANVKYVAVNMQEDRATISSALERLKLTPVVALDVDGVAAERYEVSAIPQVVVIDADGNVARMFIGVNVNFADELRASLKQLIKPAAPAANEAAGQ